MQLQNYLLFFSGHLIETNISKNTLHTLINGLRKSLSFQRSVILGASLAAFHSKRLK